MATISIYLKYDGSNLLWRNSSDENWQIMTETSVTAKTTAGDTVEWSIADDSIKKIKSIKVNKKDHTPPGWTWKDIWSTKPKADGDKFVGVVSSSMYYGLADGYEISVQIKNGADVTIDPEVEVIKPPSS